MKRTWLWYTRGTIFPHRADIIMQSLRRHAGRLNVAPIDGSVYLNLGPKLYWAWDEKQINAVGAKLLRVLAHPASRDRHYTRLKRYALRANAASDAIGQLDLASRTDRELIGWYHYLQDEIGPAHGLMDIDVDAIDVVFEKFLLGLLRRKVKDRTALMDVYGTLSVPLHETYFIKELRAMLAAVRMGHTSHTDAERIRYTFWWVDMGWEKLVPRPLSYYTSKLRTYTKDRALKKLATLDKNKRSITRARNSALKRHHLGRDIRYWLGVLDRYAQLHDLRKEMQVKSIYAAHLLMREVARRRKVHTDDLECLFVRDIESMLRGAPLPRAEIERRKRAVCEIVDGKRLTALSGVRALRESKRLLVRSVGTKGSVQGMPATSGTVTGRAKICNGSFEALKKIRTGDVLITGMTQPDCVPAMRRASAIVTDEGGLTCHAAIVARELKKPCVVGTKYATQVFKDGDRVEVNAERGIVRKLPLSARSPAPKWCGANRGIVRKL